MIRVIHITQYCHAESVGGTEHYILDLIKGLEKAGIRNGIAWLQPGLSTKTHVAGGVQIFDLPTPQMRVDAPLPEFDAAATRLLDEEAPDWLHFHTFGLTEAALAELARQRGIRCAFTYHSPAWTCRRETMLLYGESPCDGEVRAWRCSSCQSEQRLGLGKLAGHAATALSAGIGWAALPLGSTSARRRTAFFSDTARFSHAIRNFLSRSDLVVSCCDWSTPVLQRNGAREGTIFHSPQGVPNAVARMLRDRVSQNSVVPSGELVVGFVGRMVEVKGVHILMEGFSRLEASEARLRIIGWDTAHTNLPYARRLRQLAESDSRIELVEKIPFAETMNEYERMNLLAIPSTWMETGPLTLLEALALGVPVYGSNRIGQIQTLRKHGRVVEDNTPNGWHQALERALVEFRDGSWSGCHNQTTVAERLRTMEDVAAEMAERYIAVIDCADAPC